VEEKQCMKLQAQFETLFIFVPQCYMQYEYFTGRCEACQTITLLDKRVDGS